MQRSLFHAPGKIFEVSSLSLRNFRAFERFAVDLHPRLTVLVAPNGGGKTAVLDALAVAMGPFLSVFEEGKGSGFGRQDVRLRRAAPKTPDMEPCYPVELECRGWLGGEPVAWRRVLASAKGRTTTAEARPLSDFGHDLRGRVRSGSVDVELPVLAYYGTGRLWRHGRLGRRTRRAVSPLVATRTLGYRDCMDPSSNFREFAYWFRQLSLAVLQRRVHRRLAALEPGLTEQLEQMLAWVSEAVHQVLEPSGWKNVFYDLTDETIRAEHEEYGSLPVTLLSDGVRNLLAMVADMAFRCCKLNPHLGPRKSHGLVLIDEVDMHLHPAWQQMVLRGLLEAFPRLQFVVTTHSPHVVSTVPKECIRILSLERATQPNRQTEGMDSARALAEVFGVDPEPPIEVVEKLRRYRELAEQGLGMSEEARRLRDELERWLGASDPRLTSIDALVDLRSRLAR